MANAGIDQSNVDQGAHDDTALLLPENPDATCAELRAALRTCTGAEVAVIINDSHGRAFRNGTVGVAIGASGLAALADLRGAPDLYGRRLQSTEVALADEIASAASLLMRPSFDHDPMLFRTERRYRSRFPSTYSGGSTEMILSTSAVRNHLNTRTIALATAWAVLGYFSMKFAEA